MARKKSNVIKVQFRKKKKKSPFSIGCNIKQPVDTSRNADIIYVDFRSRHVGNIIAIMLAKFIEDMDKEYIPVTFNQTTDVIGYQGDFE